jgi:hypothetical protein
MVSLTEQTVDAGRTTASSDDRGEHSFPTYATNHGWLDGLPQPYVDRFTDANRLIDAGWEIIVEAMFDHLDQHDRALIVARMVGSFGHRAAMLQRRVNESVNESDSEPDSESDGEDASTCQAEPDGQQVFDDLRREQVEVLGAIEALFLEVMCSSPMMTAAVRAELLDAWLRHLEQLVADVRTQRNACVADALDSEHTQTAALARRLKLSRAAVQKMGALGRNARTCPTP